MSDPSRRRFLQGVAVGAAATAVPLGSAEAGVAEDLLAAKPDLKVFSTRPVTAEATADLLAPTYTPTASHFVRCNGTIPDRAVSQSAAGWTLTVDGEVARPLRLSLAQLKSRFATYKQAVVLECAGNGRAGFFPSTPGTQWTLGAVACSQWTGCRLSEVLEAAGIKDSAVHVAYEGEDKHLSGADKLPISRGIPVAKALDSHTMLAWEMNNEPLPALHGFPLRLIVPGYPGSASGKWLKRLWVRDQIHDGAKMLGQSYRMPSEPVAPGEAVPDEKMEIIEEMPLKSVITFPPQGHQVKFGERVSIAGKAWGPNIGAVLISIDFGQHWERVVLSSRESEYSWQDWYYRFAFPKRGTYEVWVRAAGPETAQPMIVPGWNPKGYLNNACHRVRVVVA